MTILQVHIKHAGKVYDVELDPDKPPAIFKDAVYHLTGVPPERMKVMIKGGVLKEDTDWAKVAPKSGQTFMVIGAAGELPKPPDKPILFMEDMDDQELAEALAKPVGLRNLGNTCYMNATVQAMRAIPELQTALNTSVPTSPLPKALRDLYASMSKTTDNVMPMSFLQILRQVVPQFGELGPSKGGMRGYAQQDAEECWTQMMNALKDVRGIPAPDASAVASSTKNFVEQYMTGEMRRELRCVEAPEEGVSVTTEKVLKIECNIGATTNYMLTGIMAALDQEVQKNSPTLQRESIYLQKSRMTRLPAYLTVHMVRFAWRRDINKKAKIMRKVKFPQELDALDLAAPELHEKLAPVSSKLKAIEKERAERRKIRKRTKNVPAAGSSKEKEKGTDVEMADTTTAAANPEVVASGSAEATEDKGKEKELPAGELEDESVYKEKETEELASLVHPSLREDIGCNPTGIYELVAIVTHKGADADAGHYIGFVKKSAIQKDVPEDNEDWYKFDDDKVSDFPKEKLSTLDGGGEDSAAYVLLYKSKSL